MSFHLLVPVDGSSFSRAATNVAAQLAGARDHTHVVGLHVVNVRTASGNLVDDLTGHLGFEPAVVSEQVHDAHVLDGQKVLAEFAQAMPEGVPAHQLLAEGAVAATVLSHSHHADLLILGLRGESEDRFPGQGGAQVFKMVPDFKVPALLVPKDYPGIEGIVIGYDGSPAAANALRAVRDVVGLHPVDVHAVYVSADGTGGEVLERVDRWLPNVTVHHHVISGDNPHQELVNTAKLMKANVLALGFHGHSPLKDFLYGSAGEHAMLQQDLALLIAP